MRRKTNYTREPLVPPFCYVSYRREATVNERKHPNTFTFTLATHVNRPKLKDQVPRLPKTSPLYGGSSPEYRDGANTAFWKRVNDTSVKWRKLTTTQSQPRPFESGDNVLPGLEKWRRKVGVVDYVTTPQDEECAKLPGGQLA